MKIDKRLIICSLLFFQSCTTMRYFPIETLRPAYITFDSPKDNITLCATRTVLSEELNVNMMYTGATIDSLMANILHSLMYRWKEAPGYRNTQFTVHTKPADQIPASINYDLIVCLEQLQVINSYYGQQYGFREWEAYLYVKYEARWMVRNAEGILLDKYTDRDLLVWPSGIFADKAEAVTNLPPLKDAWWDMGIAIANNYFDRVAPQWSKGVREIYMIDKFSELSLKAYKAMQNDRYDHAFDIWENMLLSCRKNGQKK